MDEPRAVNYDISEILEGMGQYEASLDAELRGEEYIQWLYDKWLCEVVDPVYDVWSMAADKNPREQQRRHALAKNYWRAMYAN